MSLLDLVAHVPEAAPNACRYAGAPGHLESYFLRANHPARPLALWLKVTIFAPLVGDPVAETWLVWFDGERHETFAHRDTLPLAKASFSTCVDGADLRAGAFEWRVAPQGFARGALEDPKGAARFDLTWTPEPGLIGEPFVMYPWRVLREGPVPRLKLNTPSPWLRFDGTLTLPGGAVSLKGWSGMQGHNWGSENPVEYTWGQCVFPATATEPGTLVEAGTARVKVGGLITPRLSTMVVRRGGRAYHFDRILDPWRQHATVTKERWSLRLSSADGEVRLRMDGAGKPMACLGYRNPDGQLMYCFNTKLADVLLEVRPRGEAPFVCRSPHGGALEFLRAEPDPSFTVV